MSVKLLTEHHLEFLNLNGGCAGSSQSTLVKVPHCRKSHVTAHIVSTSNMMYNCVKCTKYETCAILHRFHIFCIFGATIKKNEQSKTF